MFCVNVELAAVVNIFHFPFVGVFVLADVMSSKDLIERACSDVYRLDSTVLQILREILVLGQYKHL